MGKKMTLKERAEGFAVNILPWTHLEEGAACYIAGHRANKLTRAERAVVKQAVRGRRLGYDMPQFLKDAVDALARAKGGAR
jgi:hypothetical protein